MSEADRQRWDEKHERAKSSPLGAAEITTGWLPAPRGRALALDLASGRGRHCSVLLALGYKVVAVDISSTALRALKRAHPGAGDRVEAVQADLDDWPFETECFDLILQCDFLDRRLFPAMKATLRTGGHVLVDTFAAAAESSGGPRNSAYRLSPGELCDAFGDWEILRFEARTSPTPREAILARKPSSNPSLRKPPRQPSPCKPSR